MRSDQRPDVEQELTRLKDFQRATVEHVYRRLWTDDDPTRRFLVADEVGLGKTLVARGVIARTIDYLWEQEPRIDVVYICSNAQIARQNLSRLAIGGFSVDHADRLTMLPEAVKGLRRNKVNFVSFTPGTSFHIAESGGKATERVLLQRMLAKEWGPSVRQNRGWSKFFRGGMALEGYEARLKAYDDRQFDQALAQRFGSDVERAIAYTGTSLADELDEAVDKFRHARGEVPSQLSRHRYRLIGQLRNLVARAAVESLEPDLVILDEFQRFKDLLDPTQPAADLAHAIFDQPNARVLLLSATPYKMYTLPDEPEGDDHYEDFHRTVSFLAGGDEAEGITGGLRTMREGLVEGADLSKAKTAKADVESRLRRVMSRTERVRSSVDLDGMLRGVTGSRRTGDTRRPRGVRRLHRDRKRGRRAGCLRVLASGALCLQHHGGIRGQAEAERGAKRSDAVAAGGAKEGERATRLGADGPLPGAGSGQRQDAGTRRRRARPGRVAPTVATAVAAVLPARRGVRGRRAGAVHETAGVLRVGRRSEGDRRGYELRG